MIIGTNDHTNTLIKLFDIDKNINADYLEIKENDVYKDKKILRSLEKSKKSQKI